MPRMSAPSVHGGGTGTGYLPLGINCPESIPLARPLGMLQFSTVHAWPGIQWLLGPPALLHIGYGGGGGATVGTWGGIAALDDGPGSARAFLP